MAPSCTSLLRHCVAWKRFRLFGPGRAGHRRLCRNKTVFGVELGTIWLSAIWAKLAEARADRTLRMLSSAQFVIILIHSFKALTIARISTVHSRSIPCLIGSFCRFAAAWAALRASGPQIVFWAWLHWSPHRDGQFLG